MKTKIMKSIGLLLSLCVALSAVCIPVFGAEEPGVYYAEQPKIEGNFVSAKVANNSGENVMFIAAAYSGDAIADAQIQTVPTGGETPVFVTLSSAGDKVMCYLWSENTIKPYGEPVAAVRGNLPAFPGAEGGGMWTTGARAAKTPEVYHVYKLTDDGSYGTLRDAVSQPDRIIVFDVAGNIELSDTLTIKSDNLTILGQTAPGDGICVKNCNTDITGNNVILRYLRFRMGDEKTMEQDTLGSRGRHNIIVDHCSISWSVDETASFYEMTNFTMQWCIVSESLKHSVHAKEAHGYAGIWGGTNTSYHHNLLAHHDSRNPRIGAGPWEGKNEEYDPSKQTTLTDLRNNVIYNWGGNSAYGGQGAAAVNIINCYYKYGPSTSDKVKSRIFQTTSTGNDINSLWSTDIYVDGNYVDGNAAVTADNSKGVDEDNKNTKKKILTKNNIDSAENAGERDAHFKFEKDFPVTTQTAEEAYNSVLESAGASIARDSADERVVNDVKNRGGIKITKEYTDENGTTKTDTTYGIINSPSDVGGYPTLTGTKAKDTDGDGISNEWEDKNGLDKKNGSDGTALAASGYTHLEEYANALASGYKNDTAYDSSESDYDPSVNAPTPTPEPSYQPTLELVNEWTAAEGDESKPAGTEFMPGLVGIIQLEKTMPDAKEYSDGFSHNFAITSGDNGKWDAATGVATGCAMKYTAPEDGRLTLYAYGVSVKEPTHAFFYAVPEGASDPATENVYQEEIDEAGKKVLCQIDVGAGKTYYFLIPGSKARFMRAKFEKYVQGEAPKYETAGEWTAAEGDESKPAGTEFMPGLVGIIQLEKTMPDAKEYSDGFSHNFAITSGDNGKWDAATGVATGCAMKYTAPEDGRLTLYAYGVSVKEPTHAFFYAVPEGASDPATENVYQEEIDEAGKKVLCQIDVGAGKTYYFLIPGSKARFMRAKFEKLVK